MSQEIPIWLAVMRAITGLTETEGSADNPKIMHMADAIAREYPEMKEYCSYYTGDDVAWCGLTVAYCTTVAGIKPVFGDTDTERWMWAQSWADWPASLRLPSPELGCIVVMTREGGGHVTLFEHWEGGSLVCRGGNQSDQVKLSSYDPSTVIAYVWPATRVPTIDVPTLSESEAEWLQSSLNVLGAKPVLDVDGDIGDMTKEALRKFQRSANIPVSGVATKQTVEAMLAELAEWNENR